MTFKINCDQLRTAVLWESEEDDSDSLEFGPLETKVRIYGHFESALDTYIDVGWGDIEKLHEYLGKMIKIRKKMGDINE